MGNLKSLRGKLFIILVAVVIFCIGAAAITANVANAGNVFNTLMEDNFDDQNFSSQAENWYKRDKAGVGLIDSGVPALKMQEPEKGDALTSTVKVTTDNIRVQIDVKLIDFGEVSDACGWFGIIYNLKDTNDGTAFNAEQNKASESGDGVYFVYSIRQQKLLFTTINNSAKTFVDANGNDMPMMDSWNGNPLPYFDATIITDDPTTSEGNTTITNKTITVDFEDKGMKIYVKSIGEDGLGTLVARTKDNSMEEINSETPYVAFCATKYDGKYIKNIELTEFKISDISGSTVFNSFTTENVSKYKLYKDSRSKFAFFGLDSVLKLSDTFVESWPLAIRREIIINDYSDKDSYFELSGSFRINDLASAGDLVNGTALNKSSKFGILSGIGYLSSDKIGSANTTFVYFTKNGTDVQCGIDTYYEYNKPTAIKEADSISNTSVDVIDFVLRIDNKGKILLKLNGETFYETAENADNEGYSEKYVGFVLDGSNYDMNVEIFETKLTNLYYIRPENTDIYTNFEDDPNTTDIDESNSYNKNEWYLNGTAYMNVHTNSAYVRDGQLVFQNCASGSMFATQKQYSDFAIQFDITDIRREVVKDQNGNKNFPISSFIGVYWGVPYASLDFGQGVSSAYPLIYIAPEIDQKTWDRVKLANGKNDPVYVFAMGYGMNNRWTLPEKYDFWDPSAAGKTLQFRVEVVENDVTVKLKYTTETDWYTAGTTQTKASIVGNVAITTMGNNIYVAGRSEGASCGYFSADNIYVKNLDDNPNLTTLEYNTSKIPFPQDFNYVDKNNDSEYAMVVGKDEGCGSAIDPTTISMLGIAFGVALVFVKKLRRR